MRKTTTQNFAVSSIVKMVLHAVKSIFESNNDREFKRLKDFISS